MAARAPLDVGPHEVAARPLDTGGLELRLTEPLGPYGRSAAAVLRHGAADHPSRPLVAERDADGGWRTVTYAAGRAAADAIGQALLDRGLGPERGVAVLSGNSVDHLLLTLGALTVGVPVVPVSVSYSLLSHDHVKLRHVLGLVCPGLVFAEDGPTFAVPVARAVPPDVEVVTRGAAPGDRPATPFAALLETGVTPAVERAFIGVGPETVAKVMFTSGSTDLPKGVLNTHRMLCANQQMLEQVWPFTAATPPVLVDWLPWSHTFGGNHDVGLVLNRGGTLYVDGGRPVPGKVEETVRNLADVSPTVHFNVPAGYAALLPFLERDAEVAGAFFRRLQMLFSAAAAMPQDLWDRLEAVAVATTGRAVPLMSAWGCTETAPAATSAHYPVDRAGVIGVPLPGVTVRLVPCEGKLELRVKGPNVTPGYLGRPDLTAAAFDEEGFYRTGDAGRLADPDDPSLGLVFDGRLAEDFKLTTGTWVRVGALRVAALEATSPLLADAVVSGPDRSAVGLLAWPRLDAARALCGPEAADRPLEELVHEPAVVAHVRAGLRAHNAAAGGSSARVTRVLLLTEPPSIDAGEVTDKGYVNQRATLARRAALVDRLHADPPPPDVIVV